MDKHNRVTLLDQVNDPADLRGMSVEELKQLADELRRDLIEVVSVTG
jgi:1-deoxy-D-xylulose-5-phosphate synthase